MARKKTETSPLAAAAPSRRFRVQAWIGVMFILAIGGVAHVVWRYVAPDLAGEPRFVLTAEHVHATTQPPWIRTNVTEKALRDSNLVGRVSVLGNWDDLARRVKDAFEFQPWVARVNRITRTPPRDVHVELVYRKPVAAVESRDASGIAFMPIDESAVRLPEGDFTDAERRYLPRIAGVTGRPLVGDRWEDPRVVGGAKLASQLADIWGKLRLVEIIANIQSSPNGFDQRYRYEIVTSGGTRIVWGSTPGEELAGVESPFSQKRRRLIEYAEQHGKLESIEGPAVLDVRAEIVVTPRTARHKIRPAPANDTETK
ncbi:MAG: hypothetical protein IT425_05095 [Pirellulales bacterium]|nr:hypothetical protein [Pirellulales bacterium]